MKRGRKDKKQERTAIKQIKICMYIELMKLIKSYHHLCFILFYFNENVHVEYDECISYIFSCCVFLMIQWFIPRNEILLYFGWNVYESKIEKKWKYVHENERKKTHT